MSERARNVEWERQRDKQTEIDREEHIYPVIYVERDIYTMHIYILHIEVNDCC